MASHWWTVLIVCGHYGNVAPGQVKPGKGHTGTGQNDTAYLCKTLNALHPGVLGNAHSTCLGGFSKWSQLSTCEICSEMVCDQLRLQE